MGMFEDMKIDVTPALKNIPFLKDVPARAMKAAGKEARWFSLSAGGALFKTGEPADCIYFVLSGSLGAFRESPDGHDEFIGHIRAGEPVGEMALFLGGLDLDGDGEPEDAPHTGSVYAIRDSEVIAITRKGWQRMVKAEPELLEGMIRGHPEAPWQGRSALDTGCAESVHTGCHIAHDRPQPARPGADRMPRAGGQVFGRDR